MLTVNKETFWVAVYSNGFVSPIFTSKEDARNRLLGAADYNGEIIELLSVARHSVLEPQFLKGNSVLYTPLKLTLVITDITGRNITAVTPGDFEGEATQITDDIDLFEKIG